MHQTFCDFVLDHEILDFKIIGMSVSLPTNSVSSIVITWYSMEFFRLSFPFQFSSRDIEQLNVM